MPVYWLGREDSNLRMQEPKSCVLPLDDAPELQAAMTNPLFEKSQLKDFSFIYASQKVMPESTSISAR
jgi:hypothetical protein